MKELLSRIKSENDKKLLADVTHALNELYEASYEYQCSAHFSYDTKENCQIALRFEDALLQADKLLEGN